MIIVQMADGQEQAYEATSWSALPDGALEIRVTDDDARIHPVAAIAPGQWRTVRTEAARVPDRTAQALTCARQALARIAGLSDADGVAQLRDIAGRALADIETGDF